MGLAYGQRGLTSPAFHFTPLMIFQMFMLSFPICLFTFGLNDVYDYASDQMNSRKKGIEGIVLESRYHRMVKIAAMGVGIAFLCVAAATANLANVYFSVTLLCLSYVYSVPPWRLKIRPPFDVLSSGILFFFAPFALGYSFVDNATALPLQSYYFTCCVMGFHAFSTIMDYDVDKRSGDRTFAIAYGKRAAALFPAAIFLCSLFIVRVNYIRGFFMACLIMYIVVAIKPSEKIARYSFLAMFLGAVTIVSVWIASFVLG
jgi:4-hydroxybenzoate polyprenyltransferase